MKFGMTIGALLLASNVAFAQVAVDMATLERRYEDAQAAYDRNSQSITDRQEITEIRDDLGYLRVKQRRGDAVTRTERQRLSDRIDRYMARIGNGQTSSTGVYRGDRTGVRGGRANDRIGSVQGRLEIPAGSEVDVKLVTGLTSDTAQAEDRVEATTMIDL